ncbi:MAG: stage III sporulation protein AF [Bacilli bacterium]
MEFLSSYILSIVGIILLGTIIDLMLVNGQMQKYIRSIFVVFVMFVIISPIPKLLNIDLSGLSFYSSESTIDYDLLNTINASKINEATSILQEEFEENGIYNIDIEIVLANQDEFLIENILLNIKKLVIQNGQANINKYELIAELVNNVISYSGEIIFYE